MSEVSSVTQVERAQYLAYDQQRRRSLLNAIVPAGVGLSGIACLVATVTLVVNPHQDVSVWVNDVITLVLGGLLAWAWVALRRQRLVVATAVLIGAGCSGILATVAIASFSQGLTPLSFIQLASLSIVVVMVGTLGGLWTILGATLALNLVTLGVLLWAPRPRVLDASIHAQLPLLVSVSITYQWGIAVLMLAIWLTYRHTLRSLGSAFERAQQLDNLKAQFIAHINHELRTPIMTLQGYIEYLRLGRESLPEAELDAALDRASRTADTLVGLLSTILDIRRIETQQSLPAQPVRVREALDAALALIDPRLGSDMVRDLRLSFADDLEIWGDRGQLQQILTNLVSNALKYSPPGTPVEISGGVIAAASVPSRQWAFSRLHRALPVPAANVAEIVVRDYGQGIPPDQAQLLFNRFARLPRDLASSVEGSGLGLYLCRVFAEAMGGTIWVESTGVPGEGSAFYLRLPLPPAPSQALAALPTTPEEDVMSSPAPPTVAGESVRQSLALPTAGAGSQGASSHE